MRKMCWCFYIAMYWVDPTHCSVSRSPSGRNGGGRKQFRGGGGGGGEGGGGGRRREGGDRTGIDRNPPDGRIGETERPETVGLWQLIALCLA